MAATGQIAGITAGGGDPRIDNELVGGGPGGVPPSNRLLHDPKVTFQEYRYYADLTRAEEEETFRTNPPTTGLLQVLFPTKSGGGVTPIPTSPQGSESPHGDPEKEISEKPAGQPRHHIPISEVEWTNASRAVRTATGAACFYLITTDILGPFGIGSAVPSTFLDTN